VLSPPVPSATAPVEPSVEPSDDPPPSATGPVTSAPLDPSTRAVLPSSPPLPVPSVAGTGSNPQPTAESTSAPPTRSHSPITAQCRARFRSRQEETRHAIPAARPPP